MLCYMQNPWFLAFLVFFAIFAYPTSEFRAKMGRFVHGPRGLGFFALFPGNVEQTESWVLWEISIDIIVWPPLLTIIMQNVLSWTKLAMICKWDYRGGRYHWNSCYFNAIACGRENKWQNILWCYEARPQRVFPPVQPSVTPFHSWWYQCAS